MNFYIEVLRCIWKIKEKPFEGRSKSCLLSVSPCIYATPALWRISNIFGFFIGCFAFLLMTIWRFSPVPVQVKNWDSDRSGSEMTSRQRCSGRNPKAALVLWGSLIGQPVFAKETLGWWCHYRPGVQWKWVTQSVRLCATPWSIPSMGFSRPEYWSG